MTVGTLNKVVAPAEAPSSPGKVHLAYLDGIRALAALYIVCHHAMRFATATMAGPEYLPARSNVVGSCLFWFFNQFGAEAVGVFITLSGFCLTIPIFRGRALPELKGGAWSFYIKRAKRILPPYYAALGLALLLIATLIGTRTGNVWDYNLPPAPYHVVTPFDLLTHLLLLQDLSHVSGARIDGPLWTIAAEWRIYFAVPLIVWAWRRWGVLRPAAIVILVAGFSSNILGRAFTRLHIPIWVGYSNFMPEYLSLFMMGAVGAAIVLSTDPALVRLRRVSWLTVCLIPLAVSLLLKQPYSEHTRLEHVHFLNIYEWQIRSLLTGVSAAALMVAVGLGQWQPVQRFLAWKPLVSVGFFSYSLYLVHYPIEQAIYRWLLSPRGLSHSAEGFLMIALSLPITLIVAYLFYRAVEKPSHLWATRARKTVAVPPPMPEPRDEPTVA